MVEKHTTKEIVDAYIGYRSKFMRERINSIVWISEESLKKEITEIIILMEKLEFTEAIKKLNSLCNSSEKTGENGRSSTSDLNKFSPVHSFEIKDKELRELKEFNTKVEKKCKDSFQSSPVLTQKDFDEMIEIQNRNFEKIKEVTGEIKRLSPVQTPSEIIKAGSRCAIIKNDYKENGESWWSSYSPRNDNCNAEGKWSDWVKLAELIIEENAKSSPVQNPKRCTCKIPVTHHFDDDKSCVRCGGRL